MPIAVGVIETQGFSAMLATADAMVKACRFFEQVATAGSRDDLEQPLQVS